MTETGFECTAYFRGRDGLGTCDTECQWWNDGCNMAKGSEHWDGEEDADMMEAIALGQMKVLDAVVRAIHELEDSE